MLKKKICKKWTSQDLQCLKSNYGKMTIGELSKIINRTLPAIANKACRVGLQSKLRSPDQIEFTKKQYEFFDGMVASDLFIEKIERNKTFARVCGDFKYREFAEYITSELGLDCKVHRRETNDTRFKCEKYVSYSFNKGNSLFVLEHKRWYSWEYDEKYEKYRYIKKIPKDFRFSPMSILAWYMGDGDLAETGDIKISTNSFKSCNVESTIVNYLKNNDIEARVYMIKDEQPVVKISRRYRDKFLNFIGRCPISCYKYKWNWHDVNKDQLEARKLRSGLIKAASRKKFSKTFYVFERDNSKLIGKYNNQSACAEDLGICRSAISACLLGKRSFHKKYKFKYKAI